MAHGIRFLSLRNEELSFREQVEIYFNAQCVVGMHGAGLANMLWMQRGAFVMEIQTHARAPLFKYLAKAKGLLYKEYLPKQKKSMDVSFYQGKLQNPFLHRMNQIVVVDVGMLLKYLDMPFFEYKIRQFFGKIAHVLRG